MAKDKKYIHRNKPKKNPIETVLSELNVQLQSYLESLKAVSEIEPQMRRKYHMR